jgi:manganese/zinc/iron transport system permease protein
VSSTQIEIQLIAAIVAAACALPGVFLVLRRMAMMSDAIGHTVLLGIVLAFFIVRDLTSPVLILGAALVGVLTVALVELLDRTRLVKQDAAIGLVFPALFSLAVILISRYARGVHLDVDAVLMGELAFAPFSRFAILGIEVPQALAVMGGILAINLIFILLFYKELKLATFDAALSATLGFSPALIHYSLMTLVSITAVGAFDAVGSILVVALMVTPAASAYLLTDNLRNMLVLSVLIGVVSAIAGYWTARALDANIAGSMATTVGVIFLLVFLFAPKRGIVAVARRRARQRRQFSATALTIHLLQHEKQTKESHSELALAQAVRWEPDFARQIIRYAEQSGAIRRIDGQIILTEAGRAFARRAIADLSLVEA